MQLYARLVALSLFCLCAYSCRHSQDMSGFPPVTPLDSTLNTQFVPTMQDTLAKDKNVVYTPAFLFAWDELRGVFKDEIKLTWKNPYLQLIDHSTTYKGSLSDDEYTTKVTHKGETVDIIASFAKSLSFSEVMDTGKLKFDDETVKAFGMPEFNGKISAQIQILYYRDDEHFIIRITPKEEGQAITIAMGAGDGFTFEEVLKDIKHYILMGTDEFKHPAYEWKGEWKGNDELLIPIIAFNYQASYSSILSEPVNKKRNIVIKKAMQQTAFLIDEQGAKVESKAEIMVAAAAAPPSDPDAKPHVKKLFCNKPFFIMLSKKTSEYPYLMMKVCNTGMMLKREMERK